MSERDKYDPLSTMKSLNYNINVFFEFMMAHNKSEN